MSYSNLEETEQDIVCAQAAQWLIRLSEKNPVDRAAFVRWLKKSPRHVQEFLLMSAVYKGLWRAEPGDMAGIEQLIAEADGAHTNVVALTFIDDKREATAGLCADQAFFHEYEPWRKVSARRATKWAGIAAGIAFVGLGAIWAAPRITMHLNSYTTAVGEQRTVRLSDGSVVHMNARSSFRVNYSNTARDIELRAGEATFKVERVPNRPFRVHTSTATIQALGTQFNVYLRSEIDTVVSVIDGAVRVSKGRAASPFVVPTDTAASSSRLNTVLELSAGEEAQVGASGGMVKRSSTDMARATAWRERRLVFFEDRLEDIAAEFARYSSHRIVLGNEAARNKRITGTFDADDPASLIQFIEQLNEFSVERTAKEFVVRGK